MSTNVDVVLDTFRAVEQRDEQALFALYHPDVELWDAPSLPYGGTRSGLDDIREALDSDPERTWLGTWGPLQPTEAERRMDPRVVATNDSEVVVLYRQRALDPDGNRFDAPVLGMYEVRDGKFARAQMFHFDTVAVVEFLAGLG
jgi:ketosteroid isomerase-like protein